LTYLRKLIFLEHPSKKQLSAIKSLMQSMKKAKIYTEAVGFVSGLLLSVAAVTAQTVIPEQIALPSTALDKTKPGFAVRVFQATGPQLENTLARAEAQIAGLLINPATGQPFENIADLSTFNGDGVYEEEYTISYSSGFFPGIPGIEGTTINIAMEAITFIELQPGTYTMIVNSDDGFRVTTGNVFDRIDEIVLGQFDGARGASDTIFSFTVTKAGVYPFRLVYFQGGGGYTVNWYTADNTDPSIRVYLNDSAGIACYRSLKPGAIATGPTIKAILPMPNAVNVSPSSGLTALIKDGSTAFNPTSFKLYRNGKDVTAVTTIEPKTNDTTKISYKPASYEDLPASLAVEEYKLVFDDPTASGGKREAIIKYTVATYANYTLPEPFWIETFDNIAQGTLPSGWITYSPIAPAGYEDLDDPHSDSYRVWVVISRDRVPNISSWNSSYRLNTPELYINGKKVDSLMQNQFIYFESDIRSGSQYAELFTPEINCTGKTNVYLVYNSSYTQNQDNIAGVEYSIDGGTTWLPVVYMLDGPDIIKKEDGTIDVTNTFDTTYGDVAVYTDPDTGEEKGHSYGAFVKVSRDKWPDLGPYISARVNDDQWESKRIEKFRLPMADNQARVKIRFFYAGTASWFWGIDNVGLYSISAAQPPEITTQPIGSFVSAGSTVTLKVVATGTAPLSYQWKRNGIDIPGANLDTYTISNITAAAAGEYTVQVTNIAGSVTSAIAKVIVFSGAITQDLVVHLKFDGDLSDVSGRGNHGQAVGEPVFVEGKVGSRAMQITSESDYVTLGSPADLNFGTNTDFSISFWTKVSAWSGDAAFIGNKDWNSGGNQGYVLATDSDAHFQWNLAGAPGSRKDYDGPPGLFADNAWHHVVVTFHRAGMASTYIDGVLKDSRPLNDSINNVDTPKGLATNIGQDGTGTYGSRFSDVAFDDLGIWRRVLTPQEVTAIYQAGLDGKDLSTVSIGPSDAGSLSIKMDAGKVVITWTSGATLQSSDTLTGGWADVAASSPYVVIPSGTAKFYRLIKR
jgi:hypothetical protein